ncbi:hypothetical protein GHT06_014347 [Daphnia sinensis]|uniref:Uncharacterized protein n=1 Tax=Daphnia sinensis TaxID=1820382 RepID=A0AAD5LEA9_9CRUS|nr:hypothetical protein GHT06_014346 [Daphnia sinensis]KAI9560330.1 hypothetical protein GHT06_014347 [Daphnia sinensis]
MLRRISAVIPLVLPPNIENELKFMKGFYLMITSRGKSLCSFISPTLSNQQPKAFGDVAQTCSAADQGVDVITKNPDGTNKQAVPENNEDLNSVFEMDFGNDGIEEELITLKNTIPASTTMSIMVPVAPVQPVFSCDTYPSIPAFSALPISFASPPPDLDGIPKPKELPKTVSPVIEVIPCSQQTYGSRILTKKHVAPSSFVR